MSTEAFTFADLRRAYVSAFQPQVPGPATLRALMQRHLNRAHQRPARARNAVDVLADLRQRFRAELICETCGHRIESFGAHGWTCIPCAEQEAQEQDEAAAQEDLDLDDLFPTPPAATSRTSEDAQRAHATNRRGW